MVWKIGCGVTLLGLVLSLASCGLFATSLQRLQGQRSIENQALERDDAAWLGSFAVEAGASVRVEFTAEVTIGPDDLARADSTAAILESSIPAVFRLVDPSGVPIARGARPATGTTILSASTHPSRRDTPQTFLVRTASEAFETENAGTHVALLEIDDRDDHGRPVSSLRMTVFDRVPTDAGGLALGGLASALLGPLVAAAGVVAFAVGLLLRNKEKSTS